MRFFFLLLTFGLFAVSCGNSSTEELAYADTGNNNSQSPGSESLTTAQTLIENADLTNPDHNNDYELEQAYLNVTFEEAFAAAQRSDKVAVEGAPPLIDPSIWFNYDDAEINEIPKLNNLPIDVAVDWAEQSGYTIIDVFDLSDEEENFQAAFGTSERITFYTNSDIVTRNRTG